MSLLKSFFISADANFADYDEAIDGEYIHSHAQMAITLSWEHIIANTTRLLATTE